MKLSGVDGKMHEATSQLNQVKIPSATREITNPHAISKNEVTVVLPVLNEEEGISAVIDELLENGYNHILVVDGYSTDMTVQAARQKGVTVIEQHGRGKTGAIRTAFEHVSTPYMLIMDGDFTYDAADIQRFLNHVNGYDQIIGSRSQENISRVHRVGNRLISRLFNTLLGTFISDVCSGMYLLNSKSARELYLCSNGFSVEVEVLAQIAMQGQVTEVPIHYRKRLGQPKLSTLVHGFDIFKSILGLARRYNPVFLFSTVAASAAIPGFALGIWVLWSWLQTGVFHSAFGLAAGMLLLLSSQAFMIGTISVLFKRSELRIERLVRSERHRSNASEHGAFKDSAN
jgi:dolichol-phosphate mannosyltransferase